MIHYKLGGIQFEVGKQALRKIDMTGSSWTKLAFAWPVFASVSNTQAWIQPTGLNVRPNLRQFNYQARIHKTKNTVQFKSDKGRASIGLRIIRLMKCPKTIFSKTKLSEMISFQMGISLKFQKKFVTCVVSVKLHNLTHFILQCK